MLYVMARHHENTDLICLAHYCLGMCSDQNVSWEGPFKGVTRQRTWQLRHQSHLKMRSIILRPPQATLTLCVRPVARNIFPCPLTLMYVLQVPQAQWYDRIRD